MKRGRKEALRRACRFVTEDVWDVELTSLSTLKALGVRAARIVHLVVRGFREDECPLYASALTFSTLMSIVPVLALSLALARGLGDADTAKSGIRNTVHNWLAGGSREAVTAVERADPVAAEDGDAAAVQADEATAEEEAAQREEASRLALAAEADKLLEQAFEKVENVSFAALGGVGLALLLWMVISVMSRVESAFNRVWGVTMGRSILRRFTDYLSVLIILPFLATAASSFRIADVAAGFLGEADAIRLQGIIEFGLLRQLTVLIMTGLCFTFITLFMPNTRVRVRPGLAGGFVSAILFLVWLRVCAGLQVGVARSSAIYGGFAIVPILLAWVFVSWEIVLFGAEVAFAVQNCGTYRMEQHTDRASIEARLTLALAVIVEAARIMLRGGGGLDVAKYAAERRVPVRFLNDVVGQLARVGLLAEISATPGRYVLLKAPSSLRAHEIITAIVQAGVSPAALGLDSIDAKLATLARDLLGRPGEAKSLTIEALAASPLPGT